jgi:hypothetical protein
MENSLWCYAFSALEMSFGILVFWTPPPIPFIELVLHFIETPVTNLCVYYSEGLVRKFT